MQSNTIDKMAARSDVHAWRMKGKISPIFFVLESILASDRNFAKGGAVKIQSEVVLVPQTLLRLVEREVEALEQERDGDYDLRQAEPRAEAAARPGPEGQPAERRRSAARPRALEPPLRAEIRRGLAPRRRVATEREGREAHGAAFGHLDSADRGWR